MQAPSSQAGLGDILFLTIIHSFVTRRDLDQFESYGQCTLEF